MSEEGLMQLPEQITKDLVDRNQEKRDQGARSLEITIMHPMVEQKLENKIRILINTLNKKYIQSNQFNCKVGGMTGLTAIAKALSKDENLAVKFVIEITQAILEVFNDKEERVRLSAIENFYLVCRYLEDIVLLNFNAIFKQLMQRSVMDSDDIRKSISTLSNALKTIICRSFPEKGYFNLNEFMPVLCDNMRQVKNAQARMVMISWILTLNSIPHIEMYDQLPSFLEQLFSMLTDTNGGVKEMAQKQINEFMYDLQSYQEKDYYNESQAVKTHSQILDTLIRQCKNKYTLGQQLAIQWISRYLILFNEQLESEARSVSASSNLDVSGFIQLREGGIFHQQNKHALRTAIMSKLSFILEPVLSLLSHEDEDVRNFANQTNTLLRCIMEKVKDTSKDFMDILPTLEKMTNEKKSKTQESALQWMHQLFKTYSDKFLPTINEILQNLIQRIHDADNSVVENLMNLLGDISLHEQYFDMVFEKILYSFHSDQEVLEKKSDIILRKLCEVLNPQQVYITISNKLLQLYQQKDVDFINKVVQTLDYILVTDTELKDVRALLRNLKYEEKKEESQKFWDTIYGTFCYNTVSLITLGFLVEEYELSYHLILGYSEVEQDVETLMQVAKLINLLESPVFTYLRLQLLEHQKYPYLLKSLQALMMLLPQTAVYKKLKQRLSHIESGPFEDRYVFTRQVKTPLDVSKMLEIYRQTRQHIQKMKSESKMIEN